MVALILRQHKIAAAVVIVILSASAAFNWWFISSVGQELHTLHSGLCKIIVKSNANVQENKIALLATAARAAHRAQIDQAEGHTQLAQADRDAARLDQRFAKEITPTTLEGCPSP